MVTKEQREAARAVKEAAGIAEAERLRFFQSMTGEQRRQHQFNESERRKKEEEAKRRANDAASEAKARAKTRPRRSGNPNPKWTRG